jgi:hypothetical protein
VIFFISIIVIGPDDSFKVLAFMMFLYASITLGYYYRKIGSRTYLVSGIYLIVFGLTLWNIQFQYVGNPNFVFPPISRFFAIWMVLFWIWLVYLMATRKVRWKGSEVLELSAKNVSVYCLLPFSGYLYANDIDLSVQPAELSVLS